MKNIHETNTRWVSNLLRNRIKSFKIKTRRISGVLYFKGFRKSRTNYYDYDVDVVFKGEIDAFWVSRSFSSRMVNYYFRRETKNNFTIFMNYFGLRYVRLGKIKLELIDKN